MVHAKAVRIHLTREDWASAALEAMAAGGLAAIAVEPLATALGATKGSFYWHFQDRAALVDAALALWETAATESVIRTLDTLANPGEQMRTLFALTHSADASFALESVMLADAADEQVGPVLRRVTERRVDYMTTTLQRLGIPRAVARRRALLAYQAWIGYLQLQQAVPSVMPMGRARSAYLRHIMTTLESAVEEPAESD